MSFRDFKELTFYPKLTCLSSPVKRLSNANILGAATMGARSWAACGGGQAFLGSVSVTCRFFLSSAIKSGSVPPEFLSRSATRSMTFTLPTP